MSLASLAITLCLLVGIAIPVLASDAAPATPVGDLPTMTNFVSAGPGNLPAFGAKVRSGKPVTVAYIGGSITVGSGCSTYANCYYWKSRTAIEAAAAGFGSKVTFVNAGIGGTGSGFGAYRVGLQVLSHHPDLLIIEFAVNDCPKEPAQAVAAMPGMVDGVEGIVRQALNGNADTAIVLLYTSSISQQGTWYSHGVVSPSVAAHHRVAKQYGLSEILTGGIIARGLAAGEYTGESFFPDGTHPSDIGHALYAKALGEAILPSIANPVSFTAVALPVPVGSGVLEHARLDAIVPTGDHTGWTSSTAQWNWYGVPIWGAAVANEPIRFTAHGSGIQFLHTGRMQLDWTVSGKPYQQLLNGDSNMPFPATWWFPKDAMPDGVEVTVRALPNPDGSINGRIWGLNSLQRAP